MTTLMCKVYCCCMAFTENRGVNGGAISLSNRGVNGGAISLSNNVPLYYDEGCRVEMHVATGFSDAIY